MSKINIVNTRPKDSSKLETLTRDTYSNMWKRSSSQSYYLWKFFTNSRPKAISYSAIDKNILVSHLGSCHRKFRYNSFISWATELSDAMTHSDYRRRGIWEKISTNVIQDAIKYGFIPLYGTPNKFSIKGLTSKFDMIPLFKIYRCILPLTSKINFLGSNFEKIFSLPAYMCSILSRNISKIYYCKNLNKIHVKREISFCNWSDKLWEEEFLLREAGVVRNSSYLNWRFCDNPDEYKIYHAYDDSKSLGMLVTKIRKNNSNVSIGFVADIMIPGRNKNTFHKLLDRALQDFRKENVNFIESWTTINIFFFTAYISYGFLPIIRTPFIILGSHFESLKKHGLYSSKDWIFHMADSDNI